MASSSVFAMVTIFIISGDLFSRNKARNIEKRIINSTILTYDTEKARTRDIDFLKSELNVLSAIDFDDAAEEKEQKADEEISSSIAEEVKELYVQKLSESKFKIFPNLSSS